MPAQLLVVKIIGVHKNCKGMEKQNQFKMLFYGYGNTSKQDDGIGIACAECLEHWIKNEKINVSIQVARNPLLDVSDVENLADKDIVVFIDSSKENISDFYMSKVVPAPEANGLVTPGYLIYMVNSMYNRTPLAFILHIKGYKWKEDQPFSQKAQMNICKALEFLKEKIKNPEILIKAKEESCSIDLNK
jgi:hydrogenase maturation protease